MKEDDVREERDTILHAMNEVPRTLMSVNNFQVALHTDLVSFDSFHTFSDRS
jgi:hypothetical protein